MTLSDSRRLTGPNLILDGPGAAADITVSKGHAGKGHTGKDRDRVVQVWQDYARTLLNAVGWSEETIGIRLYDGGATIAITAPEDALYAATEIVEAAWDWTIADLTDRPIEDTNSVIDRLKTEIANERNPAFLTLLQTAESHHLPSVSDDDTVTLGLGAMSQSWPRDELPDPDTINWYDLDGLPVAFVTGTNGKSTTVRIAAAIGAAANFTVGFSTSDWVRVGNKAIATGDYSGPEGARLALRHPETTMAILETARGGLLRRGLPLPQATACLITNIASDHLGDYGIQTVDALADAKFTVSKAVTQSGTLVLNADDPRLRSRGEDFSGRVSWYGLSLTADRLGADATAAIMADDHLALYHHGQIIPLLSIDAFEPALGGAAKHNISNALGASLLMHHLGVTPEAIRDGLRSFENSPDDNPGRGNFIEVGGVTTLLDFAHNPHSLEALTQTLSATPAKRRLYLLGQGGDRSDEDIRDMTAVIRHSNPDAIIIKDIPSKLRGRAPGEVPALMRQYLSEMNYPETQILRADSEREATLKALEWAQAGDLVVLLVYAERDAVLSLLRTLQSLDWKAGQAVKI